MRFFKYGKFMYDRENLEICAPFSGSVDDEAVRMANEGITFTWVPRYFAEDSVPPEIAQIDYRFAVQVLGEDYFA